ncbi:SDR family NAD(P)-dependent oxidoreductase [Mesorhizobium sp. M1403]|uniref:SDR family NAD(P)-dependent oxidoreductase n=1 Tax=Mesorhizobium sp. M1403 TaxID=2957097 RepID=UPI0033354A77
MTSEVAIIAGAGSGLSASLAKLLTREGFSRGDGGPRYCEAEPLIAETGAEAIVADVSDTASVDNLFAAVDKIGPLSLAVFNASCRVPRSIADLDPDGVRKALLVGAFGGFLVGQQAARRMLARGSGSILFTGATASVKGFANSAGFAMPKFGLRGLAQSMARELAPKNIHVAHFVIDGGIASVNAGRTSGVDSPDRWLSPDAIAEVYPAIHRQHRSASTSELELRPWVENF